MDRTEPKDANRDAELAVFPANEETSRLPMPAPETPSKLAKPKAAESKSPFKLVSNFEPKGDQPAAIKQLRDGLDQGEKHQVLLGITGSGKTFTIANVIASNGKPTLILAPNKTLAAQ